MICTIVAMLAGIVMNYLDMPAIAPARAPSCGKYVVYRSYFL